MTRLEFERRRLGWNQVTVAFHARVSQGDVSLIERRRLIPTPLIVERLAQAVRVLPTILLQEVTPEGVPAQPAQAVRPDHEHAPAL